MQNVSTNALLRVDLLHFLTGNTLQISFSAFGADFGLVYLFSLDGADGMRLAGQSSVPAGAVEGRIALFSRESQLPVEFRQLTFEVVKRFDRLERSYAFNDLVSDGSVLVYQTPEVAPDAIQKIDPNTGIVLATSTSTAGTAHIQTTQDGQFWTHCGCGSSRDAVLGNNLDIVDTVALGAQIKIRAMAYDPDGRVLWLHGRDDDGDGLLLQVDADSEPDVLLEADAFGEPEFAGMAWDGKHLWVIVNYFPGAPMIQRVDPETLEVVETYRSPDESVEWTGVEFIDGRLFLLGADATNAGVIMEVSTPN